MAVRFTYPKIQAFDSSGDLLAGGKLYSYAAGTSTPKDTYTDAGAGTANANPVILDSRGEATVFGSGSYKFVLKDSADTVVWTQDNVEFRLDQILDADTDTGIFVESASDEDIIRLYVKDAEQIRVSDGAFSPGTDDDIDLGNSSHEFKDLYLDGIAYIDQANIGEAQIDEIGSDFSLKDGITYNLYPALGTDHTSSGPTVSLTAGEDVVAGNVCYIKSDGKAWKIDADASSSMPGIVMAMATISANDSGEFALPGSFIRDDTWNWTVGGTVYASVTAGSLSQTAVSGAGDIDQAVGIATHADRIFFFPSMQTRTIGTHCKIHTGTYTGDGSTGQAITGVGFQPKAVWTVTHPGGEGVAYAHWKWDQTWGDYAVYETGDYHTFYDSRINSLDTDGFTVDDDGTDSNPNANGITYDYMALG